MKEKICDVCGFPFDKGLKVTAIGKRPDPFKRRIFMCEKCENVMKLLILQHRRKKGL